MYCVFCPQNLLAVVVVFQMVYFERLIELNAEKRSCSLKGTVHNWVLTGPWVPGCVECSVARRLMDVTDWGSHSFQGIWGNLSNFIVKF